MSPQQRDASWPAGGRVCNAAVDTWPAAACVRRGRVCERPARAADERRAYTIPSRRRRRTRIPPEPGRRAALGMARSSCHRRALTTLRYRDPYNDG